MNKNLTIGILILVIIILIIYYNKTTISTTPSQKAITKKFSPDGNFKFLTYKLPTDMSPEVFGPHYWKAIHNLASEIPCGACRDKWERFTIFGHDVVNNRLGKKVFDKTNYNEWLDYLATIKKEK